MTSSIYRTWKKRITEHGTWPESWCRRWAQSVIPVSLGYRANGQRTNLTTEEAQELRRMFDTVAGEVHLTDAHTAKGLAWLKVKRNRERVGVDAECVDGFVGFVYTGAAWVGNAWEYGGGDRVNSLPIWTIAYRDGFGTLRTATYHARPWQGGYLA